MLSQIYRNLLRNSLLIIFHDSDLDKRNGEYYNKFFIECASVVSETSLDEVKKNKYFIQAVKLAKPSENVGFKIIEVKDWSREIESYLSPKIYASRFKLNDSQVDRLGKLFKTWKSKKYLPSKGIL